jgi:nicotinamide-nucleotide amidase
MTAVPVGVQAAGGRNGPCIDSGLIDRAQSVMAVLKRRNRTVVTAESCTAGLVCAVLSHVEDASQFLQGSFVTYTKANKIAALSVDPALLAREGSVNEAVARQLVAGALSHSPADIALAVSGVLGPSPDEDGNPVGLVYFGCGLRGAAPRTLRRDYGKHPPDLLRRYAVMDALALLEEEADRA